MKSKEFVLKRKKCVSFMEISEGVIECQGIVLKRLNRRISNKNMVIEYYKCHNSCDKMEMCKFSGKLVYNINSRPNYLTIIKKHSIYCSSRNFQKKHKITLNEVPLQTKSIFSLPYDHVIYSEGILPASVSIQIHKESEIANGDGNYIVVGNDDACFCKLNEKEDSII